MPIQLGSTLLKKGGHRTATNWTTKSRYHQLQARGGDEEPFIARSPLVPVAASGTFIFRNLYPTQHLPQDVCRQRQGRLLHEPAVADDEGLAGQRVRVERGEEQRGLRHVLDRGELAVDRVLQHHGLDDGVLRNAERLGLL